MKKIITSIFFIASLFSSGILRSQTTHPFELGFNAGASWLKSDIKMKKLGGAGGFTFGQMYLQNENHFFDIGWRFRYLNAIAYGQDDQKSTGIANNVVLNGVTDTALNYYSHGGFVYQNYKTTLNECSLELLIGLNKMRNKTKFYPYVFGGLGITKAVVKTNQLNANNTRYNYVKIDSLGTATSGDITANLNNLYDGTYETTAEGSRSPVWKFMPSLGVGLGFQATKVVSIGLEYKVTWALSDQLDGQQWTNDNHKSLTNDKYYYASAWLKFTFGRNPKPVSTNTTTTTTTTTNPNTFTNTGDKPSIIITNPGTGSSTSNQQNYTIKAMISNVNSHSDIGLIENGVSNSNFTYDPVSHIFTFPTTLLNGNNTFMITATNAAGSYNASTSIIFNEPVVVPPPTPAPSITITSPASNPYTSAFNTANVNATVLNISSQSELSVSVNGTPVYSFVYNPSTHTVNISSSLIPGANSFVISATNATGSDSKSVTILYNQVTQSPTPLITITSPAVNPYTVTTNITEVAAVIQNITALGQLSVTVNNVRVATGKLFFSASTGQLHFNANLVTGANTIVISATNVAGADSKTETIIYSPQVVAAQAPVITITSPTANPYNTTVNSTTVSAIVLNITAAAQIAVSINGTPTSAFYFNPATKEFSLSTGLISGTNLITITATNAAGADSKSETIIYSQPTATIPAPVVTIVSPAANPFTSAAATSMVVAKVLNVTSTSQIAVSINGTPTTSFSFNPSTNLASIPVTLIAGANMVIITASNASGADTKSETIIYSQPSAAPAPVVTITSPATSPFNVAINTATIDATVLNVNMASQIAVSMNGSPVTSFTFNPATKLLGFTAHLIAGANLVTIKATNASGTDTKSTTIIYSQPVATIPAPIVTIVSPAANPFTSAVATSMVVAKVLNVTSTSQIAVSINGTPTTSFSFNPLTSLANIPVTLIAGANMIIITATNASGADTKSATIIYSQPVVLPAPVVTITSPATNPYNVSVNTAMVNATVLNVALSSGIFVTVNGSPVSSFTFNPSTKALAVSVNLIPGSNTVTIKGTNASGTDTKSETILFIQPVVLPPVVTITSPALPTSSTALTVYDVEGTITNVAGPANITVKINGTPITTFTYMVSTKKIKFNANLNAGANTIIVSASNSAGADSKTVTILYVKSIDPIHPDSLSRPTELSRPGAGGGVGRPSTEKPTITFSVSNPYTTTETSVTITADITNIINQGNVVVKWNGVVVPFSYNLKTHSISVTGTLNAGANTLFVQATNDAGVKTQTLIINKP